MCLVVAVGYATGLQHNAPHSSGRLTCASERGVWRFCTLCIRVVKAVPPPSERCAVERAADDVKRMRWKWSFVRSCRTGPCHDANTCSSMCDPGGLPHNREKETESELADTGIDA